jgi:hypothetical protein
MSECASALLGAMPDEKTMEEIGTGFHRGES